MELINEKEFNEEIAKDYILVDFFATWCGPCKMLAPTLEKLDIEVLKVDVDKYPSLAEHYGVMSIPTLVLFKKGNLVDKKIGFVQLEELNEWITKNK